MYIHRRECNSHVNILLYFRFQVTPLMELFQPVVDWVDSDLRVFKVSERTDIGNCNQSFIQPKRVSRMPGVAVMIFLSEEGPLGYERIQSAKRRFEKPPWKFHHSEQVGKGKINPYPFNSPDYFYTSEELPLWALRLVHCGKESIRIVLFASDECWDDMIRFYKLIIGFEPDVNKNDFCMFTVYSRKHYDVQFALKKLKGETKPRALDSVKLQFRVPEVGNLVPLFPNVCKPISDSVWETRDHDGNVITIDVTGKPSPHSSTPPATRDIPIKTIRPSSRSSRSSNQSSKSENSVQSFTSVTSSSMTSSFTSLSSDQSSETSAITTRTDEDIPPKLPPRVPLNVSSSRLPEKPKQCISTLQAFYV